MNLVERFFADLTEDVIRAGSFASVGELVRDIEAYLAERNANPRPYRGGGRRPPRKNQPCPRRACLDRNCMNYLRAIESWDISVFLLRSSVGAVIVPGLTLLMRMASRAAGANFIGRLL
jgi:hypothetical protein